MFDELKRHRRCSASTRTWNAPHDARAKIPTDPRTSWRAFAARSCAAQIRGRKIGLKTLRHKASCGPVHVWLLRLNGYGSKCNQSRHVEETMRRMLVRCRAVFVGVGVALFALGLAAGAAFAQEKTSSSSCRTGCRRRIRCRRRMEEWGARVEKESGGTIKYKIFPPSSSARRSTITTWRATASPTSLTSIPAISPAASRSSPPANCRFWSRCQRRLRALDGWYRKYAAKEMKDVKYLLRLHARSRSRGTR